MKAAAFDLVPLDCPSCGAAVDAEGEDVAFYCVACRNGYLFDEARRQLAPIEVEFVSVADRRAEQYRPFWKLPATVAVRERRAAGFDPAGWMSRFFSGSGGRDREGPRGEGTFVVPAFRAPLPATLELTRAYTGALPSLGERLGERLVGARYPVEDARKLTHFALIAAEVEKRDTLQQLSYDLEFGSPSLLGVPFVRAGGVWRDALFSVPA